MPRNGSGTYSLPAGNPVASGALIEASWANTTLSDLASAMTDSLARSGEGGMTGALRLTDGTNSAPAVAFSNEVASGIYRAGTGDIRVAIAGVDAAYFTSIGLTLPSGKKVVTPTLEASSSLTIRTNGADAVTVDSSQNVGIGTSSPARRLHAYTSAAAGVALFESGSGTVAAIGLKNTGSTALYPQLLSVNDDMVFQTNGSERMRLDASGNLGIGTSLPAVRTEVSGTEASVSLRVNTTNSGVSSSNFSQIQLADTGAVRSYWRNVRDGSGQTQFAYNSFLAFLSDANGTPTERARITSGGNLLVGTTSASANVRVFIDGSATAAGLTGDDLNHYQLTLKSKSASASTHYQIGFLNSANTVVGAITHNDTNTSYGTSSDYRLKDNLEPLADSGAFIDALQPKTWDWKTDGSKGVGFIAHEVQAVSPSSVVGEKDAVDADGKPVMQSMEYGSAEFIANIVAELQSLRARVAALEGQ